MKCTIEKQNGCFGDCTIENEKGNIGQTFWHGGYVEYFYLLKVIWRVTWYITESVQLMCQMVERKKQESCTNEELALNCRKYGMFFNSNSTLKTCEFRSLKVCDLCGK